MREELATLKAGITGETSDGYHTFTELYAYRKAYNALLFNEWAACSQYDVHKSRLHSDGELCFGGGWFIVVAQTPAGQISNHYKDADWPLFQVPERERGAEWDGHTPAMALERLLMLAHSGSRLQPYVQQWQPIETAPKDGTPVWCYDAKYDNHYSARLIKVQEFLGISRGSHPVMRWHNLSANQYSEPTHWMPLPLQPGGLVPVEKSTEERTEELARGRTLP